MSNLRRTLRFLSVFSGDQSACDSCKEKAHSNMKTEAEEIIQEDIKRRGHKAGSVWWEPDYYNEYDQMTYYAPECAWPDICPTPAQETLERLWAEVLKLRQQLNGK